MHELSLCRAILDIITHQNTTHGIKHVKKITLELGQLAAVDESALRFGFEAASKNTIAEGALLDIIKINGQGLCHHCQKTVLIKRYYDACPDCGKFELTITHGEELRIKCMEIE